MLLDFVSVLNCELLANVSCNNFAKALTVAYYEDFVVAANNMNAISHNNIVSMIEFKYRDDVICVGYLVEHDDDNDRYIIDLDNVFIGVIKYDISNIVANSDYTYRAHNKTTAEANLLYSTLKSVLCSKIVKEA
jgi:hypothetical protein